MAERDFLLDTDGDLVIRNGAIAVGDSLTQEVSMLLLTNQGEMRHDPLCGCNLVRRKNSVISRSQFERVVRLQVERDGKLWAKVRDGINSKLSNG